MVILSFAATTLLLLRNNWILLYQSSNFVPSPSNYSGSGTMLFSIVVNIFLLYPASAGTVNISSVSGVSGSILLFDMLSLVILSDPNIFFSFSIIFWLCLAILSVCGFYYNCFVCNLVLLHYTSLTR